MAATGYTPIYLYYSSTATNQPSSGNLGYGELAINITDGYLFYKDNANAVQKIGYKLVPIANGGTNNTSFTAKSGNIAGLVFYDGTKLANDATVTDVGYDTSTNTFQANAATIANNITTTSGNLVIGTSGKGITTGSAINLGFGTNGSVTQATLFSTGGVSIGNSTDPGTGSLSVSGIATAAIHNTSSGSASAANNTATTIFTMPTLAQGLYLVQAALSNNSPTTFTAVSLIRQGNGTSSATAIATASNMALSVSGLNIQATQTAGGTVTISWTVVRFA